MNLGKLSIKNAKYLLVPDSQMGGFLYLDLSYNLSYKSAKQM